MEFEVQGQRKQKLARSGPVKIRTWGVFEELSPVEDEWYNLKIVSRVWEEEGP